MRPFYYGKLSDHILWYNPGIAWKKNSCRTGIPAAAGSENMEKPRVRISVRNLVEFILRSGDLDNSSGTSGDKEAMLKGGRLHRKIQRSMKGDYQAEVSLKKKVNTTMWSFRSRAVQMGSLQRTEPFILMRSRGLTEMSRQWTCQYLSTVPRPCVTE